MYKIKEVQISGLENKAAIYIISLNLNMQLSLHDTKLLLDDEIEKLNKFRNHADKVRFMVTRSCLRTILSDTLNLKPEQVVINYTDYGKPILANDEINFNVSHSEDKAIIAVSESYHVGIDIECLKKSHNDLLELSDYILSPEEISMENWDNNSLLMTWVTKESILKAVGCGLSYELNKFSVFKKQKSINQYYVVNIIDNWNIHSIFAITKESFIFAITLINT